MTQEQLDNIKNKILEEIQFIKEETQKLQEKKILISNDCSIDDLNRSDMIQEQQISEKILNDYNDRLKSLDSALLRVAKDDYGVCKECEEEIDFNRLMLVPESYYCVACLSEMNAQ